MRRFCGHIDSQDDSQILMSQLRQKKYFAIDMDGTIYLGQTLFPFTRQFLTELEQKGRQFIFLTNNSSKAPEDYQMKLQKMGLEIQSSQIYTSGEATIEYLRQYHPEQRIFLAGTRPLINQFKQAGIRIVEEKPDAVVLGFDLDFNYQKLTRVCDFIREGCPFIATHPDLNCPLENRRMLPDCGALSAAITAATGIHPIFIGKPNPTMLQGLIKRFDCKRDELAIIGDRLMTDIQMGRNFDIFSILVLTGETQLADLQNSPVQPDLVLERIVDLIDYLS